MPDTPFSNIQIKAIYDAYPTEIRKSLLQLRNNIFVIGKSIDKIGRVEESLKWGEPSYDTLSGSALRLGWTPKSPESYRI